MALNNIKQTHYILGNILKQGSLKLIHFNKGNSKFSNKINNIVYVIGKHKPDIFLLKEANYDIKNDKNTPGYNIEYKPLITNHDIARTIILIREGINYKRYYNFKNNSIYSVWGEILFKRINLSTSAHIITNSQFLVSKAS